LCNKVAPHSDRRVIDFPEKHAPKEHGHMIFREQFARVLVALALSTGFLLSSVVGAEQKDDEQERKAWDRVFEQEEMTFSKEPNAFLARNISARPPGRALDVGMGQGRNTFWLAEHGWTVTGFDISPVAVEQARREAARRRLTAEMLVTPYQSFDWGKQKWDLILFCYFFPQDTLPQVWESLRPGGLILVEGFHMDTGRMRPIGGGYTDKQMFHALEKFRILVYEDVEERQDWGREIWSNKPAGPRISPEAHLISCGLRVAREGLSRG